MWKCTNCHHVELSTDKPPQCPVCDAEAGKLVSLEVSGIKGTKTLNNIKAGFVAESQAHLRNLAFAMKAEQEDYAQVARLFRAIAEAEAVHAFNHFRLLGAVSGTQENLESAFERENLASNVYPQFIREANEENNTSVAKTFSYSRDVERGHAKLYKKALAHMKDNLSWGTLEGTIITCPVHGSQFDISNGQVVRWLKGGLMSKVGKALKLSKDLPVYNVKVEDGKVLVGF
jgi:rubrerythrin